MSWILPIGMNMDLSRAVLEGNWDNSFLDIALKVARSTVIPFMMIVMFEAIVKNFILINTLNVGITLLNEGHTLYQTHYSNT